MRTLIKLIILVSFVCIANPLLLAEDKEKGASQKAYEHASGNAIFNRISDWFATVGKSPEEKEAILKERKAQRAAQRAEEKATKGVTEAEEQGKKQTKAAKQKVKMDTETPMMQQEGAPMMQQEKAMMQQQEAPMMQQEKTMMQQQEAPMMQHETPSPGTAENQ